MLEILNIMLEILNILYEHFPNTCRTLNDNIQTTRNTQTFKEVVCCILCRMLSTQCRYIVAIVSQSCRGYGDGVRNSSEKGEKFVCIARQ